MESNETFKLYNQDGKTYEPVAGTKFKITDLNGQKVEDINGNIVGNLENVGGEDCYVLTTDEKGYIKVNLPQGLYKAEKIYENDEYILEENEEDRTYFFEIGLEKIDMVQWIKGIRGYSWNYINSCIEGETGNVMAVGSISSYSNEVAGDFYDGVDIDRKEVIDEKSNGNNDGIIISYDKEGKLLWSETFGGEDDDCCNDIVQTKDGGYVVVGYVSSSTICLKGKVITQLSKNKTIGKDGFILKIDSKGNYEWGRRIGGIQDEEIYKVLETKQGDVDIIGSFSSSVFNFYENNTIVDKIENLGEESSFIASYSKNGKYKWSKKIGGDNFTRICDITELEDGIAVAVNYKGTIKLDENKEITSETTESGDSIIIKYTINGNLEWYYNMYSKAFSMADIEYLRITAITTTKDNEIAIAIACSNTIKGKKQNEDSYSTLYTSVGNGINSNLFILSKNGEFVKNIYNQSCKTPASYSINSTIVFNDLVCSADNNIIIGGYYYSGNGIDVDKDNSTTGKLDFKASTEYGSNGFIIKLDLNGNVNYSDCMSRKDRNIYAQSKVTTVAEIDGEKIIFGGDFWGETATSRNFYNEYKDEKDYNEYSLEKIGNIEGFIIYEDIKGPYIEVLKPTTIVVNNIKKVFNMPYELPVTGGKSLLFKNIIAVIIGICLINYATYIKYKKIKEENE